MTVLLPHPTPLESALDQSIATRLALPIERVTTTWSPANCPVDQLGFLAWQLGLELWDDAWPEVKKRQVCANAFALHRAKTTLAGIKAHVALVGGEVTRAIRPPARGFMRAAMTEAQRAAWLDSLPQLRLYPFARRAIASHRWFASGPACRFFHGQGHRRASRGFALHGIHATLSDRGVERPIGIDRAADGTTRLLIGRTARRDWNGRGHLGTGFYRASAAPSGVVTLRLSDDVGQFAVAAGLDPVNVRPTRIAQGRIAPAARAFHGRRGGHLRASWAPNLIYDRVSLLAADRVAQRRRTRSFHGRGRFGIQPYRAELRVSVPMQRPGRRAGRWHGCGFMKSADMTRLTRVIEAVRVSKAARDTILLDTTTHRTARFGDGLSFGSFAFGEIRKAA